MAGVQATPKSPYQYPTKLSSSPNTNALQWFSIGVKIGFLVNSVFIGLNQLCPGWGSHFQLFMSHRP
jgi:hypothetical protein